MALPATRRSSAPALPVPRWRSGSPNRSTRVAVVDDARDGRATAAGAGIIQPWGSAASGTYYDLYAHNGTAQLPRRSSSSSPLNSGIEDLGYRRSGSLVVSTDASGHRCCRDPDGGPRLAGVAGDGHRRAPRYRRRAGPLPARQRRAPRPVGARRGTCRRATAGGGRAGHGRAPRWHRRAPASCLVAPAGHPRRRRRRRATNRQADHVVIASGTWSAAVMTPVGDRRVVSSRRAARSPTFASTAPTPPTGRRSSPSATTTSWRSTAAASSPGRPRDRQRLRRAHHGSGAAPGARRQHRPRPRASPTRPSSRRGSGCAHWRRSTTPSVGAVPGLRTAVRWRPATAPPA